MRAKYLKISLLAILAAICCTLALVFVKFTAKADGIVLEGAGDNFLLSEASYEKTEKFVYTATVNFENGNAAGLVFGADESSKWVFNIDRAANRVKLIYFSETETTVLREDWFIGNDKMNDGEKALVNPKVAAVPAVQLKVVITPENDKVYAEFYADNIRRFAFDGQGNELTIDLNSLQEGLTYSGGKTGYNCFDAKVTFLDVYMVSATILTIPNRTASNIIFRSIPTGITTLTVLFIMMAGITSIIRLTRTVTIGAICTGGMQEVKTWRTGSIFPSAFSLTEISADAEATVLCGRARLWFTARATVRLLMR